MMSIKNSYHDYCAYINSIIHPVPKTNYLGMTMVKAITRMSKENIFMMIQKNDFPDYVQISPKRIAWAEDVIYDWMDKKLEEARHQSRENNNAN